MTRDLRAFPDIRQASVGFDTGPRVPGWYFDDQRWNGFINPWISRESVILIQDWFNAQSQDDHIDLTWNPDGSVTGVEAMWVREDPEGYEPFTVHPDIAPDGTLVYSYLTYGYCWSVHNIPSDFWNRQRFQFFGENAGEAEVLEKSDTHITWGDGVANTWTLPIQEFIAKFAWGDLD